MEIRMLRQPELLPALHLVWEVFADEIAPTCTAEGVASFQKFIKYDYISGVWQRGNLLFFGAYEREELCGTLALRPDGHIALFFVKKQWQRKGVGRMLFQSAHRLCVRQFKADRITVNAAPKAVEKYIHMGMRPVSGECEADGLRFVPMEMDIRSQEAVREKPSKAPWIALGAFGVMLLLVLVVAAAVVLKETRAEGENRRRDYDADYWNEYEEPEEDWDSDEPYAYGEETPSGIAAIPEYIYSSSSIS